MAFTIKGLLGATVVLLAGQVMLCFAAPLENRLIAVTKEDPSSRTFLMDRLSGKDFRGVLGFNQQPQVTYFQLAEPASLPQSTGPTRGVVDTVQGYVTSAVGAVSNQASNLLPTLPITINVPDVVRGVVNRLSTGYNTVQQAWQNRPAIFQRPQSGVPPINPDAEVLNRDELYDAVNGGPYEGEPEPEFRVVYGFAY